MRLASSSMLVPRERIRDKLRFLEQNGYEGLELRLVESDATPQMLDEIEAAISESSIEICNLIMPGAAYKLTFDSEASKFEKLKLAKKAVEVGARLHTGTLITPEYIPQPLPLFYPQDRLPEDEWDRFIHFLNELVDHAEKVNGIVMLEPINRYETRVYHRLDQVMEVCEELASSRVKIVADFFHMNIEETDIPSSIKAAAEYIYHVQLGDNNRLLPGKGHIDFQPGFTALGEIGYDRYLALECCIPDDPENDLPACSQYLNALISKL